jgi:hypothetical protein
VVYVVRVNVVPSDHPLVVDAVRKGTVKIIWGRICAGRVESNERAFGTAQEAVVYVVRIQVAARGHPPVVEADGTIVVTAQAIEVALAGRVERRDLTHRTAQEAVDHIIPVTG